MEQEYAEYLKIAEEITKQTLPSRKKQLFLLKCVHIMINDDEAKRFVKILFPALLRLFMIFEPHMKCGEFTKEITNLGMYVIMINQDRFPWENSSNLNEEDRDHQAEDFIARLAGSLSITQGWLFK